ncbi:MAG TPA: BatD family protein [Dongiaceae bacterium]|nr:BatD family protein [Dongiaceae bacterium]
MLAVLLFAVPWSGLGAQISPSSDPYMSLLMSQPKTEIPSNAVAVAFFDPPAVRPGEGAVYRVSLNALEESVVWPEKLNAPPELGFRAGGHGQMMLFNGTNFLPHTAFNYHLRAPRVGRFTVPEFTVTVDGKPVTVPAAEFSVVDSPPASMAPAQGLVLEVPETNLYAGQAIKVRVLLGPSASGQLQTLMQVQLNGEGVLVDQAAGRQQVGPVRRGAGVVAAYIYETVLTPLQTGKLTVFAQGFSAGSRYFGPMPGAGRPRPVPVNLLQFTLLDSEPVELQVRPLPRQGELPGFTGAIGSFSLEPPRLMADPLQAGETVKLSVTVRGESNVGRLAAPPPPQVPDWQVFAATPEVSPPPSPFGVPGRQPPLAQGSATFVYTLIPLTTAARATPPIPFSYFDPKRAVYVDLTIPAVPVSVLPGEKGGDLRVLGQADRRSEESEKEPGLSGLAPGPGLAAATLAPVQRRPWFLLVQLAPAAAFFGLWAWDRRRRFLEQHPEVVLRRGARRALRRQRRALQRAARAGDARRFGEAAVAAMQAACAPHYPADPRALVGTDVLPLLRGVAQTSSLPYRGFPIRSFDQAGTACRLEVGDTAGWKPALRSLGSPVPALGCEISGLGPGELSIRDGTVAFEQLKQCCAGATKEQAVITQEPASAALRRGEREERREEFAEGAAEVARRFFVLTDAARFRPGGADAKELLALQPELEKVLEVMESRL